MKLPDLIPFLKDIDKWKIFLVKLGIDENCEEVLIYALEKVDINSEILLIELEKTNDDLEIILEGKKYLQILPASLSQELVINDFANIKAEKEVAQRLIEYCINDA